MNLWRITYISEDKHETLSQFYSIERNEIFEKYMNLWKELKGVVSFPIKYSSELASYKLITIHWCRQDSCVRPPFATIPSNGIYIMIYPLDASKMTFSTLSFLKDLWKNKTPTWESFVDNKTGKLYYDSTISSSSFLLDLICMFNRHLCDQKDIESIGQIELFIYPSSKTIVVKIVWKLRLKSLDWNKYSKFLQNTSAHVEIGLLEPISNVTKRIKYLWRRAVLGQFNILEPYTTFFSNDFLDNSFIHSEVISSKGFHRKIRSKITISKLQNDTCSLYILYYLPKFVYVDKYQLENLVHFNIGNLKKIHFIRGETNLEAASWQLNKWGSLILVEALTHQNISFFVDLPIHLRYYLPMKNKFHTFNLSLPTSFYFCESLQDISTSQSPFSSSWQLFHDHFSKNGTFHFLHHSNHNYSTSMTIHIPVLNSSHILFVQIGTFLVILTSFLYILLKIFISSQKSGIFKHKII
ncbi:hypothetical protein PNEG_01000 [Pneumocystis murina B123]|uniref:Protein PBN1 n=1 Tax=Pneumocystis murina (strain B123) TaxID=1069680 RepID=M7PK79_PNEMU|nr:hypothetical protein PNEG_01000 [Pneumocystis murina B123]EMR10854.1 hypothetical protein PNEG_01000 [Pneumocystis murina B123]